MSSKARKLVQLALAQIANSRDSDKPQVSEGSVEVCKPLTFEDELVTGNSVMSISCERELQQHLDAYQPFTSQEELVMDDLAMSGDNGNELEQLLDIQEDNINGVQLEQNEEQQNALNDSIHSEPTEPFSDSSNSYVPSEQGSNSEQTEYEDDDQEVEENLNGKGDIPKKRRRKAERALWKRLVVKHQRLSGKKYVNRRGNEVPEKKPQEVKGSKCRFKCNKNFSDVQRELLCSEYYNLGDYVRQKIYLSSLLENVPVQRKKNNPVTKNKQTSRHYFLRDSKGARHRVCLNFFCATFAFSHRVVEKCVENLSDSGLYVGNDKRINSKPHNITSDQSTKLVKEHIDSFTRVESHYCRRDSSKLYLSPDLNISVMYRLYKDEFCTERHISPVSRYVYQSIFHSYDPQLDFFIPKQDQCSQCNAFHNANDNDKEHLQEEYENHEKREKDAMDMKEEDKTKAIREKGESFRSISFDLQAILSVPYAGDSQIYYKHHLNVYNFTIYDASNGDGYCYVWDETHGSKGSAEIGSCLSKYLCNLSETVTRISSFSDTCGGQNRNKFVAAAMLFAVNNINHLDIIDLKFMESGHSYLEVDSMHATIERARRHKKIYSTREWCLLISTARLKPIPYNVTNLKYSDFYDLYKNL